MMAMVRTSFRVGRLAGSAVAGPAEGREEEAARRLGVPLRRGHGREGGRGAGGKGGEGDEGGRGAGAGGADQPKGRAGRGGRRRYAPGVGGEVVAALRAQHHRPGTEDALPAGGGQELARGPPERLVD